ncbi:MAG: iron-regulated protein [Planctomycetes bacterium]|nr:iron-regulated protein [Planctomycetota bacterium]
MRAKSLVLIWGALLTLACTSVEEAPESDPTPVTVERVVEDYAARVSKAYEASLSDASKMQTKINSLLASPSPKALAAAKLAWLEARKSYGVTEAFRFYEGPIDFVDEAAGKEGPEGRLNAWPLNEAYIDYVKGDSKTGLIQDLATPLNADLLIARNATSDEANVTTGWHAIEFLLWGQDHSLEGPGSRPVSDYVGDAPVAKRRRTYLSLVTNLLVSDLSTLATAWKPNLDNYRSSFATGGNESLASILTGVATLAGFELASERVGVPLDSNDQEDEHSCFSDNTHDDFLRNVEGIERVCLEGPASLCALIRTRDPKLAETIEAEVKRARELCTQVSPPVDRILASPKQSELRAPLEALVKCLQGLAKSLQAAGKHFDVDVVVAGE